MDRLCLISERCAGWRNPDPCERSPGPRKRNFISIEENTLALDTGQRLEFSEIYANIITPTHGQLWVREILLNPVEHE
jgi:hypothetical protein